MRHLLNRGEAHSLSVRSRNAEDFFGLQYERMLASYLSFDFPMPAPMRMLPYRLRCRRKSKVQKNLQLESNNEDFSSAAFFNIH